MKIRNALGDIFDTIPTVSNKLDDINKTRRSTNTAAISGVRAGEDGKNIFKGRKNFYQGEMMGRGRVRGRGGLRGRRGGLRGGLRGRGGGGGGRVAVMANKTDDVIISNRLTAWKKDTDKIAKGMGFADEKDFGNFINKIDDVTTASNNPKLHRIYRYLSNHKSEIAKYALLGGTIGSMVYYIKSFQKEQSGCFRYSIDKKNDNMIRYKINGNFCCNSTNEESQYIKLLPEDSHPLYGKPKWDCDYDEFSLDNNDDDDDHHKIMNEGCRGLCNLENFNRLAQFTNGKYQPVVVNLDAERNKYVYRCEKTTFLAALSNVSGNILSDTIEGLTSSRLLAAFKENYIFKTLTFILLIFIIFLFLKIYVHLKMGYCKAFGGCQNQQHTTTTTTNTTTVA